MTLHRTSVLSIFIALFVLPHICFAQIISAKNAKILKNKFVQDQKEKDRQCKAPSCLRVGIELLQEAFSTNLKKAQQTYQGKTIIVKGEVDSPTSKMVWVKGKKEKKPKSLLAALSADSNNGKEKSFPVLTFSGFSTLGSGLGSGFEFLIAASEQKKLKKLKYKDSVILRCKGSIPPKPGGFVSFATRPFFSACKIMRSIKKNVIEKNCGKSDLFFWGPLSKTPKIDPPQMRLLGDTKKSKIPRFCVKLDVEELQNQFDPSHYKNVKIILEGRVTSIDSSDPYITLGKSALSIYLGESNNVFAVNATVIEGRKAKLKVGEKITLLCSKPEHDTTPVLVQKRTVLKDTVRFDRCKLVSRQN